MTLHVSCILFNFQCDVYFLFLFYNLFSDLSLSPLPPLIRYSIFIVDPLKAVFVPWFT